MPTLTVPMRPPLSKFVAPWPTTHELDISSPGQNIALPLPGFSVNHMDQDQLTITAEWDGPQGRCSVKLRRSLAEHGWQLPLDYGGAHVNAHLKLDHSGVALTLSGIFARHVWGMVSSVPVSAQGKHVRRTAQSLPTGGVWACGVGREQDRRVHITPSLTPGVVLIGGAPVDLVLASGALACLFTLTGSHDVRRQAHVTSLDGGERWTLHDPGPDQGGTVIGMDQDAYLQAISRAAEDAVGRWPDCTLTLDSRDPDNTNLILAPHAGAPEDLQRVYALLPGEERGPFTVRATLEDDQREPAGEAVMQVIIGPRGVIYLPKWADLVTPAGRLLNVSTILEVLLATEPQLTRNMAQRMARARQAATPEGEYIGDALTLGMTVTRLLSRLPVDVVAKLDGMTFGEARMQCHPDQDGTPTFFIFMALTEVLRTGGGPLTWNEKAIEALSCEDQSDFSRALRLCRKDDARAMFKLLMHRDVLHVGPLSAVTLPGPA